MQQLIVGRYVPGQSLIHRMDPRAKLLVIFFYVFVVFLANNAASYALLCVYIAFPVLLSKVPIRYIINGLKPILWLFLFTFILHMLATKGGKLLFELGPITVYENGVKQGIYISLRFVVIIFMTTLLTLTTTPIELTDGLEALLHPFKRLGLPVHEVALMMSISLRFIPTLMEETEKVMKAQSSRGIDFAEGPLKERMRAIVSLLVPLFISSFKRAEDLAIAMEARGYQGGAGRTKFRQLIWQGKDTLALVSLLIITGLLLIVRA